MFQPSKFSSSELVKPVFWELSLAGASLLVGFVLFFYDPSPFASDSLIISSIVPMLWAKLLIKLIEGAPPGTAPSPLPNAPPALNLKSDEFVGFKVDVFLSKALLLDASILSYCFSDATF